jgi:hypothetical protein
MVSSHRYIVNSDFLGKRILYTFNYTFYISGYVKSASKVKRYEPNTVAFFATVSVKSLDHLGFYKNIVFDSIVTNIGNGYNNYQGVFTAPISGLYLFTTSLMSNHNMEFWVNFVVNRTIIARLNERGTDGRHGSGSQTIILSLNKGKLYFNLIFKHFFY